MATALDPELTCPICMEFFKDPVTLPCMHSYCRSCLISIVQSNATQARDGRPHQSGQPNVPNVDKSGRVVACPECRHVAVFNQGIELLPKNFTIANIVEKYRKSQSGEVNVVVSCDVCVMTPPANAVKRCIDCKLFYCTKCLRYHQEQGILASHTLVDSKVMVMYRTLIDTD